MVHADPSPILAPAPHPEPGSKVVVGLSGGVDSSVAALRLKRAGYEVIGLFMKNWEEDDGTEYCTALADLADAQAVADRLAIPLETANFAAEYWDAVFEHFLTEYRAGRTPNPDVLCNREIKFNVFQDYAEALGAQWVATGHYADLGRLGSAPCLLRGADDNKDQSYFLHAVPGARFERCLFPLGPTAKPVIREEAAAAGLPTHAKKDSTGICFIGERRFNDFLSRYVQRTPGSVESVEGETLGTHQGLAFYTFGQRQGLGIGGRRDSDGTPWYVVEKDLARNVLLVAQGHEHPALFHDELIAEALNWIGPPPELPLRCTAKIRYRQRDQACEVEALPEGRVRVRFAEAQRAVTPGQWVVFYAGRRCLGGGRILERARSAP
jgi:tRNA-specific 2-thiouridylase